MRAFKGRNFMTNVHLTGAALLLFGLAPSAAHAAIACTDLAKPENHPTSVTITEAVAVTPNEEAYRRPLPGPREDRRQQGIDGKTYAIRFELRLPVEWNERFVHQFNGGNDGAVVPARRPLLGGRKSDTALARGYAVVSSDAGHDGKANPDRGLAGGAAFGFDPQARRDYGYTAVATLQPIAEQIVESHYGKPIAYRYGIGSSNGGRHGMVAAERMPAVFDGLLVGYPGFNLPKAAIQHALDIQAWSKVDADITKAFSRDDLTLVAEGVLAACDSLDASRTASSRMPIPAQRPSRSKTLACQDGKNAECLHREQVQALQTSVAGPKDAQGKALYSSWIVDTGIASATGARGSWRVRSNPGPTSRSSG